MANLAILGHATRSKEVIKLLEMLGGKKDNHCCGKFINRIYFINENGHIESCNRTQCLDYLQMTLEEFEEKYPYKVGDRVIIKSTNQEVIVNKVAWCVDTIIYWLDYCGNLSGNYTADALQPYKEETMEENMEDKVNSPKHYTSHPSGIECIEITKHYDFCIGNAIKYLWRAGLKKEDGYTDKKKEIEDLQKSIWYINAKINMLTNN